jgi:hypothetical protein
MGCRDPKPPTPSYPKWRLCGRPRCCRACHDHWAWRMSECLLASFRVLPPTHFLVLRPVPGRTNAAFLKAMGRFANALRYRRRKLGLAYFRIYEWRQGIIHAHLLVRADESVYAHAREAAEVAGLAATIREVESVERVARYVVKHTKKLSKKAELAPGNFRGQLYCAMRKFLTQPFKELRKQLWEEAKQPSK